MKYNRRSLTFQLRVPEAPARSRQGGFSCGWRGKTQAMNIGYRPLLLLFAGSARNELARQFHFLSVGA